MAYGSMIGSGRATKKTNKSKNKTVAVNLDNQESLSFLCKADIVHDSTYIVEDVDTLSTIVNFNIGALASNDFTDFNCAIIQCVSETPVEMTLEIPAVAVGTDISSSQTHVNCILTPNKYMVLPTSNIFEYNTTSAARKTGTGGAGNTQTFVAPSNTGAENLTTLDGAITDATATTLTASDGPYFKVNDVIKIGSELMLVTNVDAHVLTVERGHLGTTAATHSDTANIAIWFYNEQNDTRVSTNDRGYYSANTFFGKGRNSQSPMGLVPGSVAVKVPFDAYQELGLSGQSLASDTGLTTNTAYKFKITMTEKGTSTNYDDITITTSASHARWGGSDGVLQKIQDAMDALNIGADIAIVGGDIRFTARNHHIDQKINILAPSGSPAIWNVGNIPAIGDILAFNDSRFPTDTQKDFIMLDDGEGNLFRKAGGGGTISYDTGAITLYGLPPRSEFNVSAYFNSFAGEITDDTNNQVFSIRARSTTAFNDGKVRVIIYNSKKKVEELSQGAFR